MYPEYIFKKIKKTIFSQNGTFSCKCFACFSFYIYFIPFKLLKSIQKWSEKQKICCFWPYMAKRALVERKYNINHSLENRDNVPAYMWIYCLQLIMYYSSVWRSSTTVAMIPLAHSLLTCWIPHHFQTLYMYCTTHA